MNLIGCWWDGVATETVPAQARGLHYGDGVFRTMLWWDGRIDAREQQLQRLRQDAQAIAIDVRADQLEQALEGLRAMTLPRAAIVKFMVLRGGVARGYAPDRGATPHLGLFVHEFPLYPAEHWTVGIDLVGLDARLSAHPRLAGIKHCNRLDQVLATAELQRKNAVEGLCRGPARGFQCGTRSNLFWLQGLELKTPAVVDCGVRGVTRDRIIALARRHGVRIQEVEAPTGDVLRRADGLFVCNSIFGVWPVKRLDGQPIAGVSGVPSWMQAFPHPGVQLADAS
ncbi:MAG: aminodeoxychorismate lyase [Algiphilus sp.]|uniref:aminodeoxychorismate lyase n=1 Tax=Algiphilus sp. TaxID=1872431 RepID=UPI0032EFD584